MDKKNVAIIGAGAAGSYAAYLLKKEGFGVSVFEKSKGVGGRTASWRPTQNDSSQDECSLRINYGAQFFTQKSKELDSFYQTLQEEQVISEFLDPIYYLNQQDKLKVEAQKERRFTGNPGMNDLCRWGLKDSKVYLSHKVISLKKEKVWHLFFDHQETMSGFSHCLMTQPTEQAKPLWEMVSGIDFLEKKMDGCFCLVLSSSLPLERPFAAFVRSSPISWVRGYQNLKGSIYVLHSNRFYAASYDQNNKDVEQGMIDALGQILGTLGREQISGRFEVLKRHFWRYSMVKDLSLSGDDKKMASLYDRSLMLGYASDSLIGGRIEGAFLSAHDLVLQIMQDNR